MANKTEQPTGQTPPAVPPTTEQQAPAAAMLVGTLNGKPNIFRAMFSAVLFKPAAASAKTYEDGGRKQKKLAQVLLEICNPATGKGSGVFVKGRIAAIQEAGQKKPRAEFKFFGAQNQGVCIVTDDEAATRDLAAFSKHIEAEYKTYRKDNAAAIATVQADETELDDLSL